MGCSRSAAVVVVLAAAVLSGAALAQSIEYRNRGNRNEGIRDHLPVSGEFELLSFRADYNEPLPPGSNPPLYRMRVFLEQQADAYVVVRGVVVYPAYWRDEVKPPTPWGPGFANGFEWSTRDVIDQLPLPRPKLYDLGVTVRVGSKDPLDRETVAPVILCHSKLPGSISLKFLAPQSGFVLVNARGRSLWGVVLLATR